MRPALSHSCLLSDYARAGTYGGHLELSAFAHLKRRNVKVIQPGLIYVIEWDAGGELLPDTPPPATPPPDPSSSATLSDRDRRRLRREQRKESLHSQRAAKAAAAAMDEDEGAKASGAVYVA